MTSYSHVISASCTLAAATSLSFFDGVGSDSCFVLRSLIASASMMTSMSSSSLSSAEVATFAVAIRCILICSSMETSRFFDTSVRSRISWIDSSTSCSSCSRCRAASSSSSSARRACIAAAARWRACAMVCEAACCAELPAASFCSAIAASAVVRWYSSLVIFMCTLSPPALTRRTKSLCVSPVMAMPLISWITSPALPPTTSVGPPASTALRNCTAPFLPRLKP
mmetsp:Transcript_25343/g.66287  ORF Transcript_25343/g.66287 Transcript_25343/m.66287 type:complete len:225 (-) Transcript_25343:415-1089(-)